MELIPFFLNTFLPTFVDRFLEVLYAPLHHPEMIWIVVPLVITVFLMELYFSRYPREEKGYHYALENTVYLLFIAVDLTRYLILEHKVIISVKIYVIAGIVGYSILIAILDFFHKIPRWMAWKTSSKSLIGFTAYLSIIIVYSDVLKDLSLLSITVSALSFLTLFVLYRGIIGFIHFMEPEAHDEVDELLQNVENELREAAKEAKNNLN